MYQKPGLLLIILFLSFLTYGQGVGINETSATPDASAMLDVKSTTKGFLLPRMLEAERNAITLPATGLLIFQTDAVPGFYYNSGTALVPVWVPLQPATNTVWQLTGNAGTNPAANFIGTVDANNLAFRTNNTERIGIRAGGQILINGTIPKSTQDVLEVFGAGVTGSTASFLYPINGYSTGAGAGVYGENTGTGQGLLGQNSSTGTGVYGLNSSGGIGVVGTGTASFGVSGETGAPGAAGVRGINSNANGTGAVGLGNNITAAILYANGSGLAANGRFIGSYSIGTDAPSGIGVTALGNGMTSFTNPGVGAGIIAAGENFGSISYVSTGATPVANNKWAGYFDYLPSGNGYCFVGGRAGGTDYAILSNGTKSTMVKDEQDRNRVMYCTEAPEVLFQDYGTGQLVNGRVHITLDPLLARNIYVSDSKPIKVFIQLEGDCKGVYVANKTSTGFDVIELQNGTSNTSFSYQVVANRADVKDANGQVTSQYAQNRFPVGPDRLKGEIKKAVVTSAPPTAAPLKTKE